MGLRAEGIESQSDAIILAFLASVDRPFVQTCSRAWRRPEREPQRGVRLVGVTLSLSVAKYKAWKLNPHFVKSHRRRAYTPFLTMNGDVLEIDTRDTTFWDCVCHRLVQSI
jgi:hypothetical protein